MESNPEQQLIVHLENKPSEDTQKQHQGEPK